MFPYLVVTAITVGIEDDELPEDDELIVVQLRQPEGGAEIGPDSQVTILVMANDNVAGLLGFQDTSYLVQEGTICVTNPHN